MCKRQLFGGTILCAGLIGGTAAAQDFVFSYSGVYLGAYANYGDGTGPIFDTFGGAGPWSISVDDDGLGVATATSSGSGTAILHTAYSDANSGAYASGDSYLSVTADTLVDASWNFNYGFGNMYLNNLTDSVSLIAEFSGAGSTQVLLEAGKDYQLNTLAFATGGFVGSSFTSLVIPAPGAAALFGCAGLLATRRRR